MEEWSAELFDYLRFDDEEFACKSQALRISHGVEKSVLRGCGPADSSRRLPHRRPPDTHLPDRGRALSAGAARDAMAVVPREPPPAVRMDLIMPGARGFPVTRMRYNAPDTTCIPMIIVSSKNMVSCRMRGLGQGAAGYFANPSGSREPFETRESA